MPSLLCTGGTASGIHDHGNANGISFSTFFWVIKPYKIFVTAFVNLFKIGSQWNTYVS